MNFRQVITNKKAILHLSLIGGFFLTVALFSFFLWNYLSAPVTLNDEVKDFQKAGENALADLRALPAVNLLEEGESYVIQDDLSEGIDISYPNQENKAAKEDKTKISLPKDYAKPIEIELDAERTITLKDDNGTGYTSDVLDSTNRGENATWLQKIFGLNKGESQQSYLRYQNGRKNILYSYQRDSATGERKLKNFIFYAEGSGEEQESYTVENARLEKGEDGSVKLFYQTEQDLKNDAAAKDVDPSLMERAMKTLEKEGVNQSAGGQSPDLLIPKPYYYDKDGNYQEAEWIVDGTKLTLNIKTTEDQYPLAVDPTLAFSAPGIANGGTSIVGEVTSDSFGTALAAGDLNADGKTDLIVGAPDYSSATGRTYIFFNDGNYTTRGSSADIIITGEAGSAFGLSFVTADLNADGKTDLAVGAYSYSSDTGRVYVFYNDGSIPSAATSADAIMTGQSTTNGFGYALAAADLNADGKVDLITSAYLYAVTFGSGRVYAFYNGSITTENASGADLFITASTFGQGSFGIALATGDLNADGKVDLAAGGYDYGGTEGRAFIFYNDGSIPTSAASADVTISGPASSTFGNALVTGDFNADSKIDLAVSNPTSADVHIFYNDGSYPSTYTGDDVTLSGGDNLGVSLVAGDFNGDGRTDILAGSSLDVIGQAFIFYNDGSYSSTADVVITGNVADEFFGVTVVAGDFNTDGKTDLAVGANGTSFATGIVYVFYSQNGLLNTNKSITQEASGIDALGRDKAMATGDFNADGRVDLAVGASQYSAGGNTGRVYVFYNDGVMPTGAASADAIMTGEAAGDLFGGALASGDLNADGKMDLAVGAINAGTGDYGRTYVFYGGSITTENASGADVAIVGVSIVDDAFGRSLATADMNADGEVDLIVGSVDSLFSTAGRVYIYYNDGSYPTTSTSYSVRITGETSGDYFGDALTVGDYNADGRVDLAVSSQANASSAGRVYVFNNDGSIPTTAATADALITGVTGGDSLGSALTSGDFNTDGKVDLAAGAYNRSTGDGVVYAFYGGSVTTESASGADVTITGEASAASYFGYSLESGDLNLDGRTDLIVGAKQYSTDIGRAYVFYNDSSLPTTAETADIVLIAPDSDSGGYFSQGLTVGDLNADGKMDLVVAQPGDGDNATIYFYEGRDNYSWTLQQQALGTSRISSSVLGEELRVTGETSSNFGSTFASGDLNADGKVDLVVGAYSYASSTGRVYIFYNDGSYISSATGADVVIVGQATSNSFGTSIATGDLNADGKIDLAVGATGYNPGAANTGRVYIFYNDGTYSSTAANADILITGNAGSDLFGTSLVTADFNFDGEVDLGVGASGYSTSTGRVYIFYNGSIASEGASGADITITGEATGDIFGGALTTGDLNADGKADLAVGAIDAWTGARGAVYLFYGGSITTENASTADGNIAGSASTDSSFGRSLATADMDADGEVDLIVGSYDGTFNPAGLAYIFYNDGSYPSTSSGYSVRITGDASGDEFGITLAVGDLNADGKTDLAVGAYGYSSSTGRAYIFYNDGSIPTTAATADVTITGEASSALGRSLVVGDFSNDGKADLMAGADGYSSSRGRVYMYTMNDAVTAGGATSDQFGYALAAGDLNADGKVDLAVGATGYSTNTGRAYIFYGGGSLDTSVSSADIIITGETTSNYFGNSLTTGDLNADGKTDLIAGAYGYSSNIGRAYIFYNGSIITENASGADVMITGEAASNEFGVSLVTGDLNADSKTDVVVGARYASSYFGRVYIFHNDGSIPTAASSADVTITGNAANDYFGQALAAGDLNADGETDLVVGIPNYSGGGLTGRAYIFYNDGSIPTTAGTADVTITGEAVLDQFGSSVTTGDLNADGKTDLAVGAIGYSGGASTGRAYIFYNDGSIPTTATTADVTITGDPSDVYFGHAGAPGDFNADGKTDLVVGAYGGYGRAYIFYNDGTYPSVATSADKVYAETSSSFGYSLVSGDFNTDGRVDLAVGAYGYSSSTGKAYVFSTETVTTSSSSQANAPAGSQGDAQVGRLKGNAKGRGNFLFR